MPKKIDDSKSYGRKLITLFARLLFNQKSYSLTELATLLNCSKQSVSRLVDDIRTAYGVEIEEHTQDKRKFYRLRRQQRQIPVLPLTASELAALQMCQTFTKHLLGNAFFDEAARAMDKTLAHSDAADRLTSRHFASFATGTIDYEPYQNHIRTLIEAMNQSRVCRITYRGILQKQAKTWHVKPLKIFSYRETLYLHARKAMEPGKPFKRPAFDPMLAIHRLLNVEMTETPFQYPADYDFAKVFEQNFGVMHGEDCVAEVEFTGWAAEHVAERKWSGNQEIIPLGEGAIRLKLTASSSAELIAWILSFGDLAKVTGPDWLVEEIRRQLKRTSGLYKAVGKK